MTTPPDRAAYTAPPGAVTCPQCGHQFAPTGTAQRVTEAAPVRNTGKREALINGERSWDDKREQLRNAIRATLPAGDDMYVWVSVVDITDTNVVYCVNDALFQCAWSINGDVVTLGSPTEVERSYAPALSDTDDPVVDDGASPGGTVATENVQVHTGARVLEAKGTDAGGHRVFRVRVIAYGDSKNGRRYPEAVLRAAAPLYNGAKSYDHHRTPEEMQSATVVGLAGYFTDSAAESTGIAADLHILPSRVDIAEALDAALDLAAANPDAEPLVGISHDVLAEFKPIREGGRQMQEATAITSVYSADVVAHPAAGGRPERVVAGGIDPTTGGPSATSTKETADVGASTADVLAALAGATPEQLAGLGLAKVGESTTPPPAPAPVQTTEAAPATLPRDGWMAGAMIRAKIGESALPESIIPEFTKGLPEQVTEAIVSDHLASVLGALSLVERAQLTPSVATTQVTQEAREKKAEALDAFFDGDYTKGYRSFRSAWADITGYRESFGPFQGEDTNRRILRESVGGTYDSAVAASRASEGLLAGTWDVVLGDSITRRMIKLYGQPSLQGWRKIVSDVVPIADFRTQRRERIGGYGLLPVVNERAAYQPLASPTDEEAVYNVIKRGGTEDLTLEMIANDDIGAIRQIPRLLGLAAAITLYRFVFDFLSTNPATTYDATALFAPAHNNTDNPALLSQSALTAARAKMRKQAGYGDATNILSLTPRTLIVPSGLEEIAFQLSTSAVAVPNGGVGASNTPNMHAGLDFEVVDYWADGNDWFLAGDPNMAPLIELGFYQGREVPELFTQSDPNMGSMFNNDTLTYKVRHIYGATTLDHRGFYRGANA